MERIDSTGGMLGWFSLSKIKCVTEIELFIFHRVIWNPASEPFKRRDVKF